MKKRVSFDGPDGPRACDSTVVDQLAQIRGLSPGLRSSVSREDGREPPQKPSQKPEA